jgi:hypothetical protein
MVRLIRCLTRRPEIRLDEVRRELESDPYQILLAELANASGAIRVQLSWVIEGDVNQVWDAQRRDIRRYDALIELAWWDSAALTAALADPVVQRIALQAAYLEQRVLDLGLSSVFLVDN